MESFAERLEKQKEYQRQQGNNCSICHNDNWNMACAACGWWGYVKPNLAREINQ